MASRRLLQYKCFRSFLVELGLFVLFCYPFSVKGDGVDYARNFEIADKGSYRLLTVRNTYRNSTDEIRYALVPKKEPLPKLPSEVVVIRTPVERVVVMETVYIGYLSALEELDTIIGAATVDYISSESVQKRVKAGTIKEIQIGQNLNVEQLLLMQPDLILTSISGDPTFDIPPKLRRSGLPIVLTAGYMEQGPLARSEWLKFVAAFFEKEAEAAALFSGISHRYEALKAKATGIKDRPTVMCGAPYGGVWHVPGGDSYTARFVADAGGAYLWAEDQTQGGIPLDTERVFMRAAQADVWVHPSYYRSLDELFSADERFREFDAA